MEIEVGELGTDLISRQAAVKEIQEYIEEFGSIDRGEVEAVIGTLPVAYNLNAVKDLLLQNVEVVLDKNGVKHFVIPFTTAIYLVEKELDQKPEEPICFCI